MPLRGYTVGITAERKAEELGDLLARRGARVVHAPAMHTVPLPEDGELAEATRTVVDAEVDYAVAMTGVGFRGWFTAAEHLGLDDRLRERLRSAHIVARGAKARGAVRAAGLVEAWSSPKEESGEVAEHLLHQGVRGRRVVVQLHGSPMEEFRETLRDAGAEVVPIAVYRWTDPLDLGALDRLIDAVVGGEVDALPFTSAPAATNLLDRADRTSRGDALREALRERVLLACVGPVTARPLTAAGLPCTMPERSRTAALARLVAEELPKRHAPQR